MERLWLQPAGMSATQLPLTAQPKFDVLLDVGSILKGTEDWATLSASACNIERKVSNTSK